MATANQSTTVALSHTVSAEVFQPNSPVKSRLKPIFIGPNGLRAGWRLLIFFLLLSIPATALFIMSHNQTAPSTPQTITPFLLSASDAITLAILAGAAFLMGKIEHRKFGGYGLSLTQAFRREFWIGALIGFSTITGTLLTLFLLHAYHISGLALHGTAILSSLAAWAGTFLLVGLFEEFAFRGYVQFTLGSGIGFWPAATLLSALFGLGHLIANPYENLIGSAAVVLFGLLLSFFLWKTGTLWCAVGFHAAYDWGQTFFYGVPDSGITPYHNLLHSVMSGPAWLTGGIVGPEASILTPVALLIAALLFGRYYRSRRSHAGQTLPTQTVIS